MNPMSVEEKFKYVGRLVGLDFHTETLIADAMKQLKDKYFLGETIRTYGEFLLWIDDVIINDLMKKVK